MWGAGKDWENPSWLDQCRDNRRPVDQVRTGFYARCVRKSLGSTNEKAVSVFHSIILSAIRIKTTMVGAHVEVTVSQGRGSGGDRGDKGQPSDVECPFEGESQGFADGLAVRNSGWFQGLSLGNEVEIEIANRKTNTGGRAGWWKGRETCPGYAESAMAISM